MRGVWVAIVIALVGAAGCTNTPKREMRQHVGEEFPTIPPGDYLNPREADRDQPILTPKANMPGLNTGPGMPGLGGPGGPGGPSTGPGMAPGNTRR